MVTDLEAELCGWAGRLAAATCHWLGLLATFDRRDGWASAGFPTCAHWLSWRCGLGLRASYDYVRVARALEMLQKVRAAFSRGEISYSKVRAITRIATPSTERVWLEEAIRCTAKNLEKMISTHVRISRGRSARGPNHDGKENQARCSWGWNEDGTFSLSARFDATQGALIEKALATAMASLHDGSDSAPDTSNPDSKAGGQGGPGAAATGGPERGRRRADALAALSEVFLSAGAPTLTDPTAHTINIHVDIDTLTDAKRDAPSDSSADRADGRLRTLRCDVNGEVPLSPIAVRRLLCDSRIRALIHDHNGNPLMLGRTRRHPSTRLRQAVYARDRGVCQYPGCTHTHWLQLHHMYEHSWRRGRHLIK